MAVAASFLQNRRKKEHHCASSLCNYHVHHKTKCIKMWLRLAVRMPSFLNAKAAGDVKRSAGSVSD